MNDPAHRPALDLRVDDLNGPEIRALLAEHLLDMHATSPRESVHALDLDAWTASAHRGRGVARAVLERIVAEAVRATTRA